MRKKKTFLSTSRTYLGLIFNSLSRIKKELSNIPEKELEVTLKTNDKEYLWKPPRKPKSPLVSSIIAAQKILFT